MSHNGTHLYIATQLAKYRQDDLVREANDFRLARRVRRRGRRTSPES
jgi:hypothetical protein